MGWSIRKPLGGKNSIVRRVASKPIPTLLGSSLGLGLFGSGLGAGVTDMKANYDSKKAELERQLAAGDLAAADSISELERLAFDEQSKREALGLKQRGQINKFADELQGRANDYRTTLSRSLSDTGEQFFQRLNPSILEDLNSRGLFTSQSARDTEQSRALADIARENQGTLSRFDTDIFNQLNDIRGTGLSAQLGGDQSALDAALALRKAGIQRRFDESDAQRERAFADMLAKRQSRDQLISSLLGLGGSLGGGFLAGL